MVTILISPYSNTNRVTKKAVKKSKQTMMFFLLTRSAIRPPMGDIIASGMKAKPETTPSKAADPVTLSKCMGSAKRMTALPKSEII